jgi:hypothetical protein
MPSAEFVMSPPNTVFDYVRLDNVLYYAKEVDGRFHKDIVVASADIGIAK